MLLFEGIFGLKHVKDFRIECNRSTEAWKFVVGVAWVLPCEK